jgi:peptidoglycan/LPS O-acetylase OafA/YrhL
MKPPAPLQRLTSPSSFALNPGEDRIWFAQMLRGIAALCVVYFHLGEQYWKDNVLVSNRAYLPPIELHSMPLYLYATGWLGHNRIELGDYGVALFFLISGFVIPFSLFKMDNLSFFIRRCFRIYPTYIVGLTFTTLVLVLVSHHNQLPLKFDFYAYLANATLLYDIFPYSTIDGVNWTLIIEMRFYLLCMLIMSISTLRNPLTVGAVCLLLCLSNFLYLRLATMPANHYLLDGLATVAHYSPYLIFMFVGVCFHHLFQGTWSPLLFWVMVGFLMALFFASCLTLTSHLWIKRLMRGYPLALGTFSLLYAYRDHFKPNAVLNFFAEISFPLYVIHLSAGYALMHFLFGVQPYSLLVFIETLLVFIFLAYLLHVYVEVPSNRIGHLLTKTKRSPLLNPNSSS